MTEYTKYGYRTKTLQKADDYNWIFLPGGPGLGSEYLEDFCVKLKLPGGKILVDFPKDGTNTQGVLDFNNWREGLIDLVQRYQNAILVSHSFSGMFALTIPELKDHLKGLVLMNTTCSDSFFPHINEVQKKYSLPNLFSALDVYHADLSHRAFKEFWNTYKHYCFAKEELTKGEEMMKVFSFNNLSYNNAIDNFYQTFASNWVPTTIPTLTIAGEYDSVCPPNVFTSNKAYNLPNIINKTIAQAGHCPWLNHFAEVQKCFDELIKKIK